MKNYLFTDFAISVKVLAFTRFLAEIQEISDSSFNTQLTRNFLAVLSVSQSIPALTNLFLDRGIRYSQHTLSENDLHKTGAISKVPCLPRRLISSSALLKSIISKCLTFNKDTGFDKQCHFNNRFSMWHRITEHEVEDQSQTNPLISPCQIFHRHSGTSVGSTFIKFQIILHHRYNRF